MESPRVIVVDDDKKHHELMKLDMEMDATYFSSGGECLEALSAIKLPVIIIADIKMHEMDGFELVKQVRKVRPGIYDYFMLMTGDDIEQFRALDAVEVGADAFLRKPIAKGILLQHLAIACQAVMVGMRSASAMNLPAKPCAVNRLLSNSPAMLQVVSEATKVAPYNTNVMLLGETGVGKEEVARHIHRNSSRSDKPFVAINCGAISSTLSESELFGHVAGAFTGALKDRDGAFKSADGGTLFLDEIGDLEPDLQVKLLRVLQERKYRPLGSDDDCEVDVRLICATHRNLRSLVTQGRFREDLFYRLSVFPIIVPSLRTRPEDIVMLTLAFIKRYRERFGKSNVCRLNKDAMDLLNGYAWPGNVRELQNVIERAVILAESASIGVRELPGLMVTEESDVKKLGNDPRSNKERYEAYVVARQSTKLKKDAAKRLGISNEMMRQWENDPEHYFGVAVDSFTQRMRDVGCGE